MRDEKRSGGVITDLSIHDIDYVQSILGMPNVCLTPHMAWGAVDSRNRCIAEVAENIAAFRRGEKRNRVD